MNQTKISHNQLMALAFLSLISPVIRAIPESALYYGGKAAWLSPVVAAVPVIILFLLIQHCMKTREQGEGFTHIIIRTLGPWFGRLIAVLYAAWLTFYMSFVLRMASERLVSYVYNGESWIIFAGVIIVTGCIAASGRLSSLVRSAQVFVPVIVGMLILVFLMLIPDIKIENILPVTPADIPDALNGSWHMISMLGIFAYYIFLEGYTEKGKKHGIGYVVAMLVVIMAVLAATIGVMSANVAKSMQSPFYVMIRNISFLNILERIEAVVIALWVISDFMYVGSMLMIISDIVRVTIKSRKRIYWSWITAVAVFVLSIIMGNSVFAAEQNIGIYVPVINIIFSFVLIPVILIIAKLKKIL